MLRNEAGKATTMSSMVSSSDELKKNGDMLRFEAPLPPANLPAGRYVVWIEASSSAGGDPVSRSVPFGAR